MQPHSPLRQTPSARLKRIQQRDIAIWLAAVCLCTIYSGLRANPYSRQQPVGEIGSSLICAMVLGAFWLLFRDLTLRISERVGWLSLTILLSLLAPLAAYWLAGFFAEMFMVGAGTRTIVLLPLLIAGGIWGPLSAIIYFPAPPADPGNV